MGCLGGSLFGELCRLKCVCEWAEVEKEDGGMVLTPLEDILGDALPPRLPFDSEVGED